MQVVLAGLDLPTVGEDVRTFSQVLLDFTLRRIRPSSRDRPGVNGLDGNLAHGRLQLFYNVRFACFLSVGWGALLTVSPMPLCCIQFYS